MYYTIEIYSYKTERSWIEKYESYYLFRKRVIKLRFSKDLVILSRSLLEEERWINERRNIKIHNNYYFIF